VKYIWNNSYWTAVVGITHFGNWSGVGVNQKQRSSNIPAVKSIFSLWKILNKSLTSQSHSALVQSFVPVETQPLICSELLEASCNRRYCHIPWHEAQRKSHHWGWNKMKPF